MDEDSSPDDDELQAEAQASSPQAAPMALGGASRTKADAFLEEQTSFIRTQKEHLHEQRLLLLSHLRWRRYSDRMRGGWQSLLAVLLAALAVIAAIVLWNAVDDHGLVIDAFSVPPDLAQKGVSGEVAASQLLDDLNVMGQSPTSRPTNTYRNSWENDVRIEIPDTGVSIGEFQRALHALLGHETHISGSIYHTPDGVAVTARMGDHPAATFTGPERELPQLIRKAAEHIFAADQPYRYAEYLVNVGQFAKSESVLRDLIAAAPESERSWAWSLLGIAILDGTGDLSAARARLLRSLSLDPSLQQGLGLLQTVEIFAGHDERALRAYKIQCDSIAAGRTGGVTSDAARVWKLMTPALMDEAQGDYRSAVPLFHRAAGEVDMYSSRLTAVAAEAADAALGHDPAGARAALLQADLDNDAGFLSSVLNFGVYESPYYAMAAARGDWRTARDAAATTDAYLAHPPVGFEKVLAPHARRTWVWPWLALAEAQLGDLAAAHALIDRTPPDCYLCLRLRGRIDAAGKNWSGAAYWFARAVQAGPSIPFAFADWGAMLLAKGDRDGAIAKFSVAHARGPHFADPLELWGEALIAKNRSDLALAKFAEAAQYAPNWGRLHLKWGEALHWTDRKGDARAEFAKAEQLGLTAAENRERLTVR